MTNQLVNGIKSVSTFSIVDNDNNSALAVLTGADVTFNTGIGEEVVNAASQLGVNTPVLSTILSEDPQLQVTFPTKTLENFGLAVGYKWDQSGSGIDIPFEFNRVLIPTKTTFNALGAGFEGEGVTLDEANAIASVKRNNQYTALTRVTHTGFDPGAQTDSFSIGADGAFNVSTDVVGAPVALVVPYTLQDIYQLSEVRYASLKITVTWIMHDNQLVQMQFVDASPVLDGASVNFGETSVQVTFRNLYTGANCRAYTLRALGKAIGCE